MGREDIDVSAEMRRLLDDEGIETIVEAELLRVEGVSGEKVSLSMRTASGDKTIAGKTSSSRWDASQTQPASDLRLPVWRSMRAATFA
jgi:hypothetical protein